MGLEDQISLPESAVAMVASTILPAADLVRCLESKRSWKFISITAKTNFD